MALDESERSSTGWVHLTGHPVFPNPWGFPKDSDFLHGGKIHGPREFALLVENRRPLQGALFRCPLGITEGTFEEVTLQRANQDTNSRDPHLTSWG